MSYDIGETKEHESGAVSIKEFPFRPVKDFVYVAWFGLPNLSRPQSEGGIWLPDPGVGGARDDEFGRYMLSMWRYGIVIAKGPGYLGEIDFMVSARRSVKMTTFLAPSPELALGDVVMFSRKHGTRLPNDHRVKIPHYDAPLLVRVLDSSQCLAKVEGFEPFWDVVECQEDPAGVMTG